MLSVEDAIRVSDLVAELDERYPELRPEAPCETCNRREGAHARAERDHYWGQLFDRALALGDPALPLFGWALDNGAPQLPPMRDERGLLVPLNCCRRKPRLIGSDGDD